MNLESQQTAERHYRKNGELDMRYNASRKEYVNEGIAKGINYRKDGGLDMRYNASKEAMAMQERKPRQYSSPTFASVDHEPVVQEDKFISRKLRIKANEGSESYQILSFELFLAIMKKVGYSLSEQEQDEIAYQLNSINNIKIDERKKTIYGKGGYVGNEYHDAQIIAAVRGTDKVITNKHTKERISEIRQALETLYFPEEIQAAIVYALSDLRDEMDDQLFIV